MEPLQPPQCAQITRTVRPHDAAPMGSDIGRGVQCKLKPYFMCSAVVRRTPVIVKLSYGVHGSPWDVRIDSVMARKERIRPILGRFAQCVGEVLEHLGAGIRTGLF